MFQTKVVEEIKAHILCSVLFFQKSCHSENNLEKYGRARQSMDDDVIQHRHSACWLTKATDTHSYYVILTAFP